MENDPLALFTVCVKTADNCNHGYCSYIGYFAFADMSLSDIDFNKQYLKWDDICACPLCFPVIGVLLLV